MDTSWNNLKTVNQMVCRMYAFLTAVAGLVTINTLGFISADRYWAVVRRTSPKHQLPRHVTAMIVCGVWFYAILWAVCPILGWGSYILDGIGTTCTFDYLTRSWRNRSFVLSLVFGNFVLPLSIMTFSYLQILNAVRKVEKGLMLHTENSGKSDSKLDQALYEPKLKFLRKITFQQGKGSQKIQNESFYTHEKIRLKDLNSSSIESNDDIFIDENYKEISEVLSNKKSPLRVDDIGDCSDKFINIKYSDEKSFVPALQKKFILFRFKSSRQNIYQPERFQAKKQSELKNSFNKMCFQTPNINNLEFPNSETNNKHIYFKKSSNFYSRNNYNFKTHRIRLSSSQSTDNSDDDVTTKMGDTQKKTSNNSMPILNSVFSTNVFTSNHNSKGQRGHSRWSIGGVDRLFLKQHGYRLQCEYKTIKIIMYLLLAFILSWFPLVVVSMIGLFGDKSRITYLASILPSLTAKTSMVLNPVLYSISHPKVRRRIYHLLFNRTHISFANNNNVDGTAYHPRNMKQYSTSNSYSGS